MRERVGPDLLIGLSTHSREQLAAGLETDADYVCVGPVYATPTKPDYPAVGLDLVRRAAETVDAAVVRDRRDRRRRTSTEVAAAGARARRGRARDPRRAGRPRRRGRACARRWRRRRRVSSRQKRKQRQRDSRAPPRPPSRSERKDAEARAALVPLEPGERPLAVTVGAIVAAALGIVELRACTSAGSRSTASGRERRGARVRRADAGGRVGHVEGSLLGGARNAGAACAHHPGLLARPR